MAIDFLKCLLVPCSADVLRLAMHLHAVCDYDTSHLPATCPYGVLHYAVTVQPFDRCEAAVGLYGCL